MEEGIFGNFQLVPLGDEDLSSEDAVQERHCADERWRRACRAKYVLRGCNDAKCLFVHDLQGAEVDAYLDWNASKHHQLFDSTSSSSVITTSSKSGGSQAGDRGLERKRLQYQEYQSMLRSRFQGMNNSELAAELPVMPSGGASSIGSVLHEGRVCRPCRNMASVGTCKDGIHCMYCHLPHQMPKQLLEAHRAAGVQSSLDESNFRRRARGDKAGREEYRRLVAQHEADIKKDPFNWNVDNVVIPPFMRDPQLIMKFLRRLETIANDARETCQQRPSTAGDHVPHGISTSAASSGTQRGGRARRLISL